MNTATEISAARLVGREHGKRGMSYLDALAEMQETARVMGNECADVYMQAYKDASRGRPGAPPSDWSD